MKRKQAALLETAHQPLQKRAKSSQSSIFDRLSEELCFQCLSDLGYTDLLAVSETNKYLNRLASDNQVRDSPK